MHAYTHTRACTQAVGHRSLSCCDTPWILLHTSLQCVCVCSSVSTGNCACLISISSFYMSVYKRVRVENSYLAFTHVFASNRLSQTRCCCCTSPRRSPVIILRPQRPQQRTAGVPVRGSWGSNPPQQSLSFHAASSYIQMYSAVSVHL